MGIPRDRPGRQQLRADRDVPGAEHPADGLRALRLRVAGGPLLRFRRRERPVPGVMDDAHVAGGEVPHGAAVPPRDGAGISQPGADGEDGGDAAETLGRALHPRHRGRLAGGGVRALRLRVPLHGDAYPAARGDDPDLPPHVDGGVAELRRALLHHQGREGAAAAGPHDPDHGGSAGRAALAADGGSPGRRLEHLLVAPARSGKRTGRGSGTSSGRRPRRRGATRPTSRSA